MKTKDKTIERNYISKHLFLFSEYDKVKQGTHYKYKYLKEFYESHSLKRQVFLKYYNRYKQNPEPSSILPRKRGPNWHSRRPSAYIENLVVKQRNNGRNKFEIYYILKPILKHLTPSPSGIYNILVRHNLNRLKPKMKEAKREIIKTIAGELGHIDVHHLTRANISNDNRKYYLLAVVDSCTRIAWAEVTDSLKALDIMFATMRCFYRIADQFGINFKEVITDNGVEFSGRRNNPNTKNLLNHPFERLLFEMNVKHRYTRPYRPQTNGKVERFWRTIEEDVIVDADYDCIDELKNEISQYLLYYNYDRPHQGKAMDGKPPAKHLESLSAN